MSTIRKIGKNIVWLISGDFFVKLAAFFTTIYLARKLTAVGFGKLAFVQSIGVYLYLIVDSGLSVYGTREIARCPSKRDYWIVNILGVRITLAFIIIVIFFIIVWFLNIEIGTKYLLIGTSLWLIPIAINIEFAFQGVERMEFVSLSRLMSQIFYLILILLFIESLSNLVMVPIYRALGGTLSSVILIGIYLKYFSKFSFESLDIKIWSSFLKDSFLIGASFIVIKVYYTFDTIMLGLMDKPEVVGWYNAAYKIILLFVGLASLFQTAFAAAFSSKKENLKELKDVLKRYSQILFFLASFSSGFLILAAKPIVHVIYGEIYSNSINALVLLSFSLYFIFLDTIYMTPLLFTGNQKFYLFAVLGGAFANLILNFLLIPSFSYLGAAAATVFSNMIVFFLGMYFCSFKFNLRWEDMKLVGYGSIIFFVTIFLLMKLSHISLTATFSLVSFLIVFILWKNQKKIFAIAKEII